MSFEKGDKTFDLNDRRLVVGGTVMYTPDGKAKIPATITKLHGDEVTIRYLKRRDENETATDGAPVERVVHYNGDATVADSWHW